MFGIDAPELIVIALVALMVIGPKELPSMLRTWGRWMSQMRTMASEFRGHVDDMVRQSEIDEIRKSVDDIKESSVLDLQALDPSREIKEALAAGEADASKAVAEIDQALRAPDPLALPAGQDPLGLPAVAETAIADKPVEQFAAAEPFQLELIPSAMPAQPAETPEPAPAKTAA